MIFNFLHFILKYSLIFSPEIASKSITIYLLKLSTSLSISLRFSDKKGIKSLISITNLSLRTSMTFLTVCKTANLVFL